MNWTMYRMLRLVEPELAAHLPEARRNAAAAKGDDVPARRSPGVEGIGGRSTECGIAAPPNVEVAIAAAR